MKKRLLASVFLVWAMSSATAGAAPLLVNTTHPLQPQNYEPPRLVEPIVPTYAAFIGKLESELTPETSAQLENLFAAASHQGIKLMLTSGYRPYDEQRQLFGRAMSNDQHQETVAPPGFSEHQTGLAADIATTDQFCAGQGCFMLTKAATWLTDHAHEYGFITRYPRDKTAITGYEYEPWHLRYVGKETATTMSSSGATLEEYLAPSCSSRV